MYVSFAEKPTRPSRAQQLWQILVSKASNRQVTTYGELEKIVGYKGAGVFAQTLGHIAFYCQQDGLPPLTAIVVTKKTGLPGDGMPATKNLNSSREEVFRFEWFKVVPPTPSQLSDAYSKAHS